MKIDLARLAKLANLPLSVDEKEKLQKQLEETIEYVDILNEIPTENIESTNHVTGLENITREDLASESLSQEEALKNAKSTHNGLFKVSAIFEHSS